MNINAWLPSRNTAIFLSVTSGLGALKLYDEYRIAEYRKQIRTQCLALASEPFSPINIPRMVFVYRPASVYARQMWEEHVKWILDEAALDYKIYTIDDVNQASELLQSKIHEAKEHYRTLQGKYLSLVDVKHPVTEKNTFKLNLAS